MYSALPAARCDVATQAGQAGSGAHDSEHPETIETRLWLEEHDWLFTVLRSEGNVSPTFRFPDLISACVSLVFLHDDAPARIFDFLGTQLVLRPPLTPRRAALAGQPPPQPQVPARPADHGLRVPVPPARGRRHAGAAPGPAEHGRASRARAPVPPRMRRKVTARWCWGFAPHAPRVTSLWTRSVPAPHPLPTLTGSPVRTRRSTPRTRPGLADRNGVALSTKTSRVDPCRCRCCSPREGR